MLPCTLWDIIYARKTMLGVEVHTCDPNTEMLKLKDCKLELGLVNLVI